MKVDANNGRRLYHAGNFFWATGCNRSFMPGGIEEFSGWRDEQMSWKTDCYIGDWTPCLDEVYLSGADAIKFLSRIMTNSVEKFSVGKAKHCIFCNPDGKVMADGIVMHLEEEKYVVYACATYVMYQYYANAEQYPNMTMYAPEYRFLPESGLSISADLFKFQVSGPKALALCEKVVEMDLKNVKFMNFITVNILGSKCYALRQGMAGEVGFEIQGPIEKSKEIFDYIFEAGKEFNCRRLGNKTAMINHLEACFATYFVHYVPATDEGIDVFQRQVGYEPFYAAVCGSFDGEWDELAHSPYEMGWGSCIKFDHDFIGREALEKESAAQKRKIVTLELNSEDMISLYASLFQTEQEPYELNDLPMNSYCHVQADKIYSINGKEVGLCTTPGYSYYFRKMLALSFVDMQYSTPGTEVTVLWGSPDKPQKMIRATVQPAPYKKDNRKVDLHNL